ncbi:hypothetical protein [Celeribacter neptunius]|uniref:Type II secretory pathway, pseudopilin PulG n=1 Tax=Celeribacter neptunius TaxID=588602 RepID=A0A1I3URB7_9RHOB|nr:hypothetical protein [Celeribacter neptunius]SFJ84317.1 hypothetical protein SAMN04487991_3130 [Celeribacter neptunius]
MAKLWPLLALALLTGAVLIAGLIAVGSPQAARVAKRDDQRFRELQDLERYVQCLARADARSPEALVDTPLCTSPLRPDALLAQEGYSYRATGPQTFQLCAQFADLDGLRTRGWQNRLDAEGCLNGILK